MPSLSTSVVRWFYTPPPSSIFSVCAFPARVLFRPDDLQLATHIASCPGTRSSTPPRACPCSRPAGRKLQKNHSQAALKRAKEERTQKKKKTQSKTIAKAEPKTKKPSKSPTNPLGTANECCKKYKLKVGTKIVLAGGVTKIMKRDVHGRVFWGAP